jgi:hypothetical protein
MTSGRSHRLAFSLAVTAAAVLAWALAAGLETSASPAMASAATNARAAAGAMRCRRPARTDSGDKRADLRRKNARQKRPNVVLINTDDMNVSDMFVMRHTLALLGARGTTFRNSYVSYPLCCPSRATQLTGQYAHNHGVRTDQRFTDLDSTNTLAVWLKRAKYRTAMVGKYLNGYGVVDPRQVPPGWKQWFGLTGGTEQKRYGFKLNENGKVHNYLRKPANYIDYVLDAKVNGLVRTGRRATFPSLARTTLTARRAPRSGRRAIRSPHRDIWGASATSRHPRRRTSTSRTSPTSRSRSATSPVSPTRTRPTSTAGTAAGWRACSPSTTR